MLPNEFLTCALNCDANVRSASGGSDDDVVGTFVPYSFLLLHRLSTIYYLPAFITVAFDCIHPSIHLSAHS